jgi:hypothetical protein
MAGAPFLEVVILFECAAERLGDDMFAPALRKPAVFIENVPKGSVQART